MFRILYFKKDKGFTLLEMIIATFILVIAVVGLYSLFSQIIVATSIVSSRLTAAYLAQEGIEIIRNIRDTNWLNNTNWDNELTSCSFGCEADYRTGTVNETTVLRAYENAYLNVDVDGFYSYSTSGSPTKFKRKITVTPIGDVLKISVSIEWEDRGKTYNFTTEENLYNWH